MSSALNLDLNVLKTASINLLIDMRNIFLRSINSGEAALMYFECSSFKENDDKCRLCIAAIDDEINSRKESK